MKNNKYHKNCWKKQNLGRNFSIRQFIVKSIKFHKDISDVKFKINDVKKK